MFSQTAAWKYDGTIDFFLDTVNPQYHYWGSSLIKDHPDVVKSGQGKLTVKCVDIARILKQYDEKDLIVIKMDIEGAEYELLLDFLVKDVYKLIDYMAVEFHPQIAHRLNTTESVFLEMLKLFNTKYVDWK
jgi:FkbM family methyltransferase